MSHSVKRHFFHALRLAPVFVFLLLVAMPSQDALALPVIANCSVFGSIPILGSPHSETYIGVDGEGLKVRSATADFETVNPVYNWRYDIRPRA